MKTKASKFPHYHQELVAELSAIGNPSLGTAIQKDRGSQLTHLGIRFPALRERVKQGFSFYELPEAQILNIWDDLWNTSPHGDVLFAALEYYAPLVRKQADAKLWAVMRHWSRRVDNWCHSDGLSNIYSHLLEADFAKMYPQLVTWNNSKSEWLRRISLVSLIHYSGKNAVFLTPEQVFPLVANCLKDSRHYVQTAVGWVLRETGLVYKKQTIEFIKANMSQISNPAFARATERLTVKEKSALRKVRNADG